MATIPEKFALALEHHQAGRLQAAEQLYRQILQIQPNHPHALYLLGVLAFMMSRLEIAIQYFKRTLEVKPDFAEAHNYLGITLLSGQGKLDEGIACLRRALQLKPDFAEAQNNLGNALKDQGKLDEAVGCFRGALALKPGHAETHNNLGVALGGQGKLDEAVASYRQALLLKPDYAEAHNNLGVALKDQGKLDEAVACYRQALALKPDYADAHGNLGVARAEQGKPEEAIACYRQALALKPDHIEACIKLGDALKEQGKLNEAVASFRRTLELKPDYAEAHHKLAVALGALGRVDEALDSCQRVLALQPDHAEAHWQQSLLLLLSGDFERGWEEFEWRARIKEQHSARRIFSRPLWGGQPLAGRTVLIHADQGLGDTIQFVRYAPLVKERGGTVLLECQPPLVPLLKDTPGVEQLVARGARLPPYDVRVPLLSLPAIFGTKLASIPAAVPYLRADPARVAYWAKELAPLRGLKIGIDWLDDPSTADDCLRFVCREQFESLARVDGVRLVSLHTGPGAAQVRELAGRFVVFALSDRLNDEAAFPDVAAVMMNLDLVVTVDTPVAHLAGALGVPVWLALSFAPDWRWLQKRADTPWYPTMRLFRQDRLGEWTAVFERIAAELSAQESGVRSQETGVRRQESGDRS